MMAGSTTRILLVRHAESHANRAGEMVGRRDVELTDRGLDQARAIARYIRSELGPVAPVIVSSPLARAYDTAKCIGNQFAISPVIDDRFVELDYGSIEGVPFVELLENWPPVWLTDRSVPVPGGESHSSLEARVADGFAAALEKVRAGDESLVIVTHLGPVKAIIREVLDADTELYVDLMVGHASVTELVADGDLIAVESINVTGAD